MTQNEKRITEPPIPEEMELDLATDPPATAEDALCGVCGTPLSMWSKLADLPTIPTNLYDQFVAAGDPPPPGAGANLAVVWVGCIPCQHVHRATAWHVFPPETPPSVRLAQVMNTVIGLLGNEVPLVLAASRAGWAGVPEEAEAPTPDLTLVTDDPLTRQGLTLEVKPEVAAALAVETEEVMRKAGMFDGKTGTPGESFQVPARPGHQA